MAFTRDFDDTAPIDHTLNSQWPTKIRNWKTDVADRLSAIISGFVSGETVKGILALPFIAVTKPATITDQFQLYGKAVGGKTELHGVDEDGNEIQITSGGKVNKDAIDLTGKVGMTGDESVAGVKTFSSFPVTPSSAPTTDYQAANKKYVDDKVAAVPAQVGLGSWQSGTSGTAATDIFVCAYVSSGTGLTMTMTSGGVVRQVCGEASDQSFSGMMPVKKGDTWSVSNSSACYYISLGS